jgi:ribosomal protein S18 acetylase RimI-like enzyme
MVVDLQIVYAGDRNLRNLISKLDEELRSRYPQNAIYGLDLDDPKTNEVIFVIAYAGNEPVSCGAIRPLDHDTVELKRFFVEPAFRNQGIAGIVLTYLEEQAVNRGYQKIKLETGPQQPEAIHLYTKYGFYEIPRFGEYIHCNYSLCFEKMITQNGSSAGN